MSTPAPDTIIDKTKRVVRTFIQVGIPAFLGFAVILPQIISALGLNLNSHVYAVLVSVAGGVTLVAGAITRIMLIPAVNKWLSKLNLGATPTPPTS